MWKTHLYLHLFILMVPWASAALSGRFRNDDNGETTTELNIDYERIYNLNTRPNRDSAANKTLNHNLPSRVEICDHELCYNTTGYPEARIRRILSRSQFISQYFESSEDFADVTIGNRFNTDEMALCETMVHTIYPEKAKNLQKMEKVIVNVEGHKQGIVFETCVNTGKCMFSSSFPNGYTSYCKQKYIHKRLMVLEEGGDKLVFDTFEVPSCCVCTVKKTDRK